MDVGKRMPLCVGTFDSEDKQCSGDKKGATDNEKRPCVYRDRCFALQQLSHKDGKTLDHYVTLKEDVRTKRVFAFSLSKKLLPTVQRLIDDYRINGGLASARRRLRPLALVKPKAPKAEKILVGDEVASWLFHRISERLEMPIVPGMPLIGELFVVDRLENSRYRSLYLKTETSAKMAIVSAYMKSLKKTIEVRIAIGYSDFCLALSELNLKNLAPVDYTGKDGNFNIRITNVDREKAALIADALVPLVAKRL